MTLSREDAAKDKRLGYTHRLYWFREVLDGTMAKVEAEAISREAHDIDLDKGIDDVDEIDGDEQLALVWCQTHEDWEWHWIPR